MATVPLLRCNCGLMNILACRDQIKVDISQTNTVHNHSVSTENPNITFQQLICSERKTHSQNNTSGGHFLKYACAHSLVPKPKTTVIGLGVRLVHM